MIRIDSFDTPAGNSSTRYTLFGGEWLHAKQPTWGVFIARPLAQVNVSSFDWGGRGAPGGNMPCGALAMSISDKSGSREIE